MSKFKKVLSGIIALVSAYMLYYTYGTPQAHAWVIAMTGWLIVFLEQFE